MFHLLHCFIFFVDIEGDTLVRIIMKNGRYNKLRLQSSAWVNVYNYLYLLFNKNVYED